MGSAIDGARVGAIFAAAVVLAASARPAPPPPQTIGAAQPVAGAQYTPCEYACGQVARCQLATYEVCLLECRRQAFEQQPGGPEQLHAVSRMTCEELAQHYDAFTASGDQAPPATAPPPATSAMPGGHWVSAPSASYTNAAMVSADFYLEIDLAGDGSFTGWWARYICMAQAYGIWSCSLGAREGTANGTLASDGSGWIDLERLGRSTLTWSARSSTELSLELPRDWQDDGVLFRATIKR